jgi:hypothetical protein
MPPYNGSGVYTRPAGQPVSAGTDILDTTFNALTADLATALTNCVTRDGQSPATANIPMGGYKLTGLGAATANGDAVRFEQVSAVANGVSAGKSTQVDQAITATVRATTTTLGTTLQHTLSDTSADITAFNGVAGVTYHCRALGAGTIVYHATDLIITQGLATVTTAAGDTFDVEMITGTTCRVKNYLLAILAPGTATNATNANRTDSGEVTVTAHATTGDIFAAAANSILWDDAGGAITTTIFPNASKAGMTRDLRLNGASKFTAGANLLIEGINSGNTITLGSGAEVHVRAITTTQFKLTYSYSGTFTATGTGFSGTAPTATTYFKVENGWADINGAGLIGTSNSVDFTITGLPADVLNPATIKVKMPLVGIDNTSTYVYTVAAYVNPSTPNVITLGKTYATAAWTNSGSKGLYGYHLRYNMN